MSEIRKLILIPHIEIQNANALSSPFTIGFPAMSAWLGATHALQRHLNKQGFNEIRLKSTAIICHQFNLHIHKGVGDFVNSIVLTRNPLKKDGKSSSFIEEARCDLEVSLLIEFLGIDKDDEQELLEKITELLNSKMKMAGGDIWSFGEIKTIRLDDGDNSELKRLNRLIMPGYAIVERRNLMKQSMQEGQDALDAMLDYLKVTHTCEQDEQENITWTSQRKTSGWIVPIATGFHGISELGEAKNQRDSETPHRFAESIVTLGEFVMPYRIKSIDEILWHYQVDLKNNLYLCQQNTQK